MSKLVAFISLALLVNVALGVASTPVAGSASLTASAFNVTPVKVFDVTNKTDAKNWPPGTFSILDVIFGPGADNTTVWAYGVTSSPQITGLVARKVSTATLISGNDNSGTELSVSGSDAVSTTLSIVSNTFPVLAVGNGYLAAAAVVSSTGGATSVQTLNLVVWAAGSTIATTTAIVSSAPDAATSTPATTTDYNIGSVWYQDGYFYIIYSVVAGTTVPASGSTVNTWTEGSIYLQAIGAPNASKLYTAPQASVTGLTNTIDNYYRTDAETVLYHTAGPSNYTLPAYVYVLYKNAKVIMGVPVNRTSGAPGTANTLTTDVTQTSAVAGMTYRPSGVWYANGSYGALISNATQAAGTSSAAWAYALARCNGSNCADSGFGVFSNAMTTAGGVVGSWVFPYNNTGYVIFAVYPTTIFGGSGAIIEQIFNSSSSAASTSVTTFGNVQGNANFFRDSINSIWLGYVVSDTANVGDVYSGYIGRVAAGSSFANVLASFFAFLCLLLASLFAF